jgi:hypothetical protein
MTPKEKAIDLKNKFYYALPNNGSLNEGLNSCESRHKEAVVCALIAVDEIIEKHYDDWDEYSDYWQEVKQEIEKL